MTSRRTDRDQTVKLQTSNEKKKKKKSCYIELKKWPDQKEPWHLYVGFLAFKNQSLLVRKGKLYTDTSEHGEKELKW